MLTRQWRLQVGSFKVDPITLEGEQRAEFIRWNVLALEDELHEAMNELRWKPWATGDYLNRDAYVKELVDAWHFFMNLLLIAVHRNEVGTGSISDLADEVYSRYFDKVEINAKRQKNGYDGVSTKCSCGRALEDQPRGELVRPGGRLEKGYLCMCARWHPDVP